MTRFFRLGLFLFALTSTDLLGGQNRFVTLAIKFPSSEDVVSGLYIDPDYRGAGYARGKLLIFAQDLERSGVRYSSDQFATDTLANVNEAPGSEKPPTTPSSLTIPVNRSQRLRLNYFLRTTVPMVELPSDIGPEGTRPDRGILTRLVAHAELKNGVFHIAKIEADVIAASAPHLRTINVGEALIRGRIKNSKSPNPAKIFASDANKVPGFFPQTTDTDRCVSLWSSLEINRHVQNALHKDFSRL